MVSQQVSVVILLVFVGLLLGLFLLSGSAPSFEITGLNGPLITIHRIPIRVEIADTPAKRQRGLSDRELLPANRGMLFLFPKDDYYGIWMRGMKFSLDIIWIDDSRRIVDIAKNVSPETYPKIFEPEVKARYVLEIDAGFADSYNLAVGDVFETDSDVFSRTVAE
jgi:uncharacterized membrane protein (UPF0127 family)